MLTLTWGRRSTEEERRFHNTLKHSALIFVTPAPGEGVLPYSYSTLPCAKYLCDRCCTVTSLTPQLFSKMKAHLWVYQSNFTQTQTAYNVYLEMNWWNRNPNFLIFLMECKLWNWISIPDPRCLSTFYTDSKAGKRPHKWHLEKVV